ncbi:hypothetical protein FB451DRAFT_1273837, partial [Mycena latifolia]
MNFLTVLLASFLVVAAANPVHDVAAREPEPTGVSSPLPDSTVPLLRGRHRSTNRVRRCVAVSREWARPDYRECDLRGAVCVRDSVPV